MLAAEHLHLTSSEENCMKQKQIGLGATFKSWKEILCTCNVLVFIFTLLLHSYEHYANIAFEYVLHGRLSFYFFARFSVSLRVHGAYTRMLKCKDCFFCWRSSIINTGVNTAICFVSCSLYTHRPTHLRLHSAPIQVNKLVKHTCCIYIFS